MKAIFLDIDGVIKEDYQGAPFLEESICILKQIADNTGAKIVMSSTWKVKYKNFIDNGLVTEFKDIERLYNALKKHGLSIYDYTPYLSDIEWSLRRPAEIREYLNNADNIESFCILDDRDEFQWGELSDNLVLTFISRDENGQKTAHLTDGHMKKAIKILG